MSFKALVLRTELLGAEKLIYATVNAEFISADEVLDTVSDNSDAKDPNDPAQENSKSLLVVRLDSAQSVSVGDTIELFIRPGACQFFNLCGGDSITV
jgi:hypothetical protein